MGWVGNAGQHTVQLQDPAASCERCCGSRCLQEGAHPACACLAVPPGGQCPEPPIRTAPHHPDPSALHAATPMLALEIAPWERGWRWLEKGGEKNVEAGGCNHPSCCLFPQTNSRAIRVGEFKQRLSFPGTISPNENLIFFYRTLLH